MAPLAVTILVAVVLVRSVTRVRTLSTDPRDKPFRTGRAAAARAAELAGDAVVGVWPVRDYRWKARPAGDSVAQTDFRGLLHVTPDAVLLRTVLRWDVLLGIGVLVGSYAIPRRRISAVDPPALVEPSRYFRFFGVQARPQLAVHTDTGATCVITFAAMTDAQAVRDALLTG